MFKSGYEAYDLGITCGGRVMKKLIPILLLLSGLPNLTHAQFIETSWRVAEVVGEPWFANPSNIIGKDQNFFKGWAEGVFYECDYKGQSFTYTRYQLEEFLKNREFELFKKHQNELRLDNKEIFVHRITCNGHRPSERRLMYPFVTTEDYSTAYYLFEGAIYILTNSDQ